MSSREESFYDASEGRRDSASVTHSNSGVTLAEDYDQELPGISELPGIDLFLLRGSSDEPVVLSLARHSTGRVHAKANGIQIRLNLVVSSLVCTEDYEQIVD